jgi:hypothetical protein
MHKMNVLALASLLLFSVNNATAVGQDPKEIVYACHEMGHEFADVPMITSNIDLFVGLFNMNVQRTELQLKKANQEFKVALLKNVALIGAFVATKVTYNQGYNFLTESLGFTTYGFRSNIEKFVDSLTANFAWSVSIAAATFAGLNIHDAWKKRSELTKSLELDKEILAQLMEIKESMIEEEPASEEVVTEVAN